MHKTILVIVFFLFCLFVCLFFIQIFFFNFPIVKMYANYSEICKVGNLEADFQQVPLAIFFF